LIKAVDIALNKVQETNLKRIKQARVNLIMISVLWHFVWLPHVPHVVRIESNMFCQGSPL